MLMRSYRTEVFRPKCNPGFQSLHCIAHLDQDISQALPYLNAVLEGDQYHKDPPSLTIKAHGKLITLHGRQIAVNALRDQQEADKIIKWLQREVNQAWEKRQSITPSFSGRRLPLVWEILKRLPQSNCGQCGQSTCMVFAVMLRDGAASPRDCPPLSPLQTGDLAAYLGLSAP